MSLIHVENLTKTFERAAEPVGRFSTVRRLFTRSKVKVEAVKGVSFNIARGELVGYLGPNGAGKSTTIKLLTGILVPTSGTVEVAGLTPWRDRRQNALHIGAVFGQRTQLWTDLPLRDSLDLIGDVYGMPPEIYRKRLAELSELLGLETFIGTPVRFLSLGQRMRGDLAAALIYEPDVLYLDEPTVGLDVIAKRTIRNFIGRINEQLGTTVMLTTHDMEDVEALCSRLLIIDDGQVLFDGTLDSIKAQYGGECIVRVVPADMAGIEDLRIEGTNISVHQDHAELAFDRSTIALPEVLRSVTSTWAVRDISVLETSLSDIIARIYADSATRRSGAAG